MQFIAIENSCSYTAMAVRNIAANEEIHAYYGPDYFQDIDSGCPCRSCQPDIHACYEAEEQERKLNLQRKEETDHKIIEDKRKGRKERRKEKRKAKSSGAWQIPNTYFNSHAYTREWMTKEIYWSRHPKSQQYRVKIVIIKNAASPKVLLLALTIGVEQSEDMARLNFRNSQNDKSNICCGCELIAYQDKKKQRGDSRTTTFFAVLFSSSPDPSSVDPINGSCKTTPKCMWRLAVTWSLQVPDVAE